ncbi:MAG: LytTR family DNA-binding domain-containing protein [Burkholderiaceae bacterium]
MMLASEQQSPASGDNIQLSRIPVVSDKKVSFIEAGDVLCLESQAHYTRLLTQHGYKFCNLSIGDLELRLNNQQFLRVHRRFIVNVKAVSELERIGSKTQVVIGNKSRTIVPVSRDELGKLKFLLGLHR